MYVFPEEIRRANKVSFGVLQQRLLDELRCRVRQGMVTERGLARASGLSQPHVHNLLKGVRTPTVESADALLGVLDPGVMADLFRIDQWQPPEFAGPSAGVPVLTGIAGPGVRWVDGWRSSHPFHLPCSAIAGLREPAALRLERDADMRISGGMAAVDCGFREDSFPIVDQTYVVIIDGCGVVRWVRPGRQCLYLATNANLDHPASWVRLARDTRVVARVGPSVVPAGITRE